jgi:hypothetical protein
VHLTADLAATLMPEAGNPADEILAAVTAANAVVIGRSEIGAWIRL